MTVPDEALPNNSEPFFLYTRVIPNSESTQHPKICFLISSCSDLLSVPSLGVLSLATLELDKGVLTVSDLDWTALVSSVGFVALLVGPF